jgi:hypothetical protein
MGEMDMKYFAGINNIDELKKLYKKLALANHPDRGGNEEVMKEINNEYEKAFNSIKNGHNATNEKKITEMPDEFMDILNKIINLAGLDIELCGSWIWVSGTTYPHRATLKESGFMWASKKQMWYWRPEEAACKSRRNTSMEEIRTKYGSERISFSPRFTLT